MAAIANSWASIATNGNIRRTGTATTTHSVLEFIQWLMKLQCDAVAAGDDILDITVDTPFERSTDQILTLNPPFNIDDTLASFLYDGSVSQTNNNGETLYSGLRVIGPVETGTEYMIIQNGTVLPAFWGTGINPEAAPSLVFSRHLVKSKVEGSPIDGQRIVVLARELGDQYRRFPVTLGTGNAVAAISNGEDVFNTNTDATIGGWTSIVNTEGFQELNIDGGGASGQEFYSKWDLGTETTLNYIYERTKWISQRAHVADETAGPPSGADFPISDGTYTGQAQSFIPPSGVGVTEKLVEARFNIKIGAGAPPGDLYAELIDSDDASPAAPTGAVLARSENVLGSSITTSYAEVIFRFNIRDPSDGSDQASGLNLGNAEYFIALRTTSAGDVSNYFVAEGQATSSDATQNQADYIAAWAGSSTDDIYCLVKSCPPIHGIPGEMFQGINVEVYYDAEAGAGVSENEIVFWGTKVFYDGLAGGPFFPGEPCTIRADAVEDADQPIKATGTVLYDDGTDELIVALDNPSAAVINDDDEIEGLVSGATCAINTGGGAILDEDKGGGSGILLAQDDNTGSGELYLQVWTGVNPVDNNLIRSTTTPLSNYVTAAATINTRTLIPEFVGASTGSNMIGAYGIGYDPDDVGSSDRFTSLDNTTRQPPNNVQFTVSGLVAGEDRVLVGPRSGTSLDRGMWLVATALTTQTETSLVVKTGTNTVPFPDAEENWPDSGIGANVSRLRIEREDGIYQLIPYDSHNGNNTFTLGTPVTGAIDIDVTGNDTFVRVTAGSFLDDGFEQGCRFTAAGFASSNGTYTIDTVTATEIKPVDPTGMTTESGTGDETLTGNGWDFNDPGDGVGASGWDSDNAPVDNDVFLAFIDLLASATSHSFTGVHGGTDRNLFVRVRDGGGTPTKTFESTAAQFLSTPQTVAAIRTPDA